MGRSPIDHGWLAVIRRAATIYHQSEPITIRNSFLVFVCGAAHSTPPQPPVLRQQFLASVSATGSNSLYLLAESAAGDMIDSGEPRFVNLALFEKTIAEIADAVILFSESPGSWAELGYFSAKPDILTKLLVVVDQRYQHNESFINNGPIDVVNGKSMFRPTIAVRTDVSNVDFTDVMARIESRAKSALRKRPFEKSSFMKMNLRNKFLFLQFLIYVMGDVTYNDLIIGIKEFCRDVRVQEIDDVITILCSTRLVLRDEFDPKRFRYSAKLISFLSFKSQALDEIRTVFAEANQRVTFNVP